MAKGFMIFLEGGEPPKKVHPNVQGAYKEIYRLSKLYPDKTVTLYHVVKRVKNETSIGSHLPHGSTGAVNVDQLVTHDKVPAGSRIVSKKQSTRLNPQRRAIRFD